MNTSNAFWVWPWWEQAAAAVLAAAEMLAVRWALKYLFRWEPRYQRLLAERGPRRIEDLYWDLLRARDAKLAWRIDQRRLAARRAAQELSTRIDVDDAALDRLLQDVRPSVH